MIQRMFKPVPLADHASRSYHDGSSRTLVQSGRRDCNFERRRFDADSRLDAGQSGPVSSFSSAMDCLSEHRSKRGRIAVWVFRLAEQPSAGLTPDVLTLQLKPGRTDHFEPGGNGGVAVTNRPPRTRFIRQAEEDACVLKANRIAIHHPLGRCCRDHRDRLTRQQIQPDGASELRREGRQLSSTAGFICFVIDLFPPFVARPSRYPQGNLGRDPGRTASTSRPTNRSRWLPTRLVPSRQPTLSHSPSETCFLSTMPLFLDAESYVIAPLESTYQTTWSACPTPFRNALA